MKKLSTLLFSFTLFTAAFAQTNAEREEAKRIILGERNGSTPNPKSGNDRDIYGDGRTVYGDPYPDRYPSSYGSSRERRIYEINREYDAKINSVRWNRNLSRNEKERIIRRLEIERRSRLRQAATNYSKDRRYDKDDCDDDDRYKRNNGKRNGWYKKARNSYTRK